MYVIREIMHCRPGRVRELIGRFGVLSDAITARGGKPIRLLTDVSGGRFWTMVAEVEVERVDDFFELEKALMADESVRKAMDGYHEAVDKGFREIYRLER